MNRAQAKTILLGLGEPTSEQRRVDAVGAVIDLLQVAAQREQFPVQQVPAFVADESAEIDRLRDVVVRLETELDTSRREYAHSARQHEKTADAMERARAERDKIHEAHGRSRGDWRRIERALGLYVGENASPSTGSVVRAVERLAVQGAANAWAGRYNDAVRERNELLTAAHAVLDNDYDSDSASLEQLREVVVKINNREDT